VVSSLDFQELDLGKAREYGGGRATIATIGGWRFVAAPDSPVVTRFAVAPDGTLTEDGSPGRVGAARRAHEVKGGQLVPAFKVKGWSYSRLELR
jgi:hypothetical protein